MRARGDRASGIRRRLVTGKRRELDRRPVHVALPAFKWGTEEAYTVEQWLWCASCWTDSNRGDEGKSSRILKWEARTKEPPPPPVVGAVFIDDRLFTLVSATRTTGDEDDNVSFCGTLVFRFVYCIYGLV